MAAENDLYSVENQEVYIGPTWTEWFEKLDAFERKHAGEDRDGNPEWDALMKDMPHIWDFQIPKILTTKSLEELSRVLMWAGEGDPEAAHGMEKEAMNNFIAGVAEGAFTPEEAKELAGKLMEISGIPFSRWFA